MKCIVCGRPTRGTPYGRTILAVCDQCDDRSRQENQYPASKANGGAGARPIASVEGPIIVRQIA